MEIKVYPSWVIGYYECTNNKSDIDKTFYDVNTSRPKYQSYLLKISIAFMLLIQIKNLVSARQKRSYQEKAEFMRHHPCPSTGIVKVRFGCKGYVIDHIASLAYGGEDKAYNMQWQTKEVATKR